MNESEGMHQAFNGDRVIEGYIQRVGRTTDIVYARISKGELSRCGKERASYGYKGFVFQAIQTTPINNGNDQARGNYE